MLFGNEKFWKYIYYRIVNCYYVLNKSKVGQIELRSLLPTWTQIDSGVLCLQHYWLSRDCLSYDIKLLLVVWFTTFWFAASCIILLNDHVIIQNRTHTYLLNFRLNSFTANSLLAYSICLFKAPYYFKRDESRLLRSDQI